MPGSSSTMRIDAIPSAWVPRDDDAELRAAVGRVRGLDAAAVQFDDPARHGQAQARPGRAGREERLEDALRRSWWQPGTKVLDGEYQVAVLQCHPGPRRPARRGCLHRIPE